MRRLVLLLTLAGCLEPSSLTCDDGRTCPASSLCDEIHHACVQQAQIDVCSTKPDGEACSAADVTGLCDRGYCISTCGDGIQNEGEECDCGANEALKPAACTKPNEAMEGATCSPACKAQFCGNGVIDPGEICDDANISNDDTCALECKSNVTCGNGYIDAAIGEQCDDKNLGAHDGCSPACTTEAPSWQAWNNPWAPRYAHVAAYDAATTVKRLIVFGGGTSDGYTNSHWERQFSSTAIANRAWQEKTFTTGTAPSSRVHAVMAYDAFRGVIVMFGGYTAAGASNETWEYNGTSWTLRTPASPPVARSGAAMAYDATRKKVVLFGGASSSDTPLGDTWTWDGATWVLVNTNAAIARLDAAMAYDPAGKLVLFGGATDVSTLSDTLELASASSSWVAASPTKTPGYRLRAAMAYSTARSKIVLYGGYVVDGGGTMPDTAQASDTWEYSGTTWTQITVPKSPPAVEYATLVNDPDDNVLVLVGGQTATGYSDEVWEYNGTWTSRDPAQTPGGRSAGLAYDAAGARALVFGGDYDLLSTELWAFDGTRWSKPPQSGTPPSPRIDHALAYDDAHQKLLVFSGWDYGGNLFSDGFTWNGTAWSAITGTMPAPRYGAAIAYDAKDSVIVLFGGGGSAADLGDTWEFNGTSWTQVFTSGPPAQAYMTMTYDPVAQRLVGYGADQTWAYSNHTWTQLAVAPITPHRTGAMLTFMPDRGRVLLYGGQTDDATYLNDAWELSIPTDPTKNPAWVAVSLAGDPPPAASYGGLVGDPARHDVILFGGQQLNRYSDATWFLQYRSSADGP